MVLRAFNIAIPITAENQRRFLEILFSEAETLNPQFIIWFCIDDYDTLWETVLSKSDVGRIWHDIGLYDENLNARTALDVWQAWYGQPVAVQ